MYCKYCDTHKDTSEFRSYFKTKCSDCLREYIRQKSAEWKLKNPERRKQIDTRYAKKNRLQINERQKIANRKQYNKRGTAWNTDRLRDYRKTENGYRAIRRSLDNYRSKHPERVKAWAAAQSIPKSPCVVCGDKNVHRHHPDPLKPLEVIMLCPKHHKDVDTGKLLLQM